MHTGTAVDPGATTVRCLLKRPARAIEFAASDLVQVPLHHAQESVEDGAFLLSCSAGQASQTDSDRRKHAPCGQAVLLCVVARYEEKQIVEALCAAGSFGGAGSG